MKEKIKTILASIAAHQSDVDGALKQIMDVLGDKGLESGDSVRIIDRIHGHQFNIGDIVLLRHKYINDGDSNWLAEGPEDDWYIYPGEFELV